MVYNNSYRYKETDHMCDVICDEPSLLQMISRFGIPLGVGDQTVRQVCEAHGVDTLTFLSVANFIRRGARGAGRNRRRAERTLRLLPGRHALGAYLHTPS